MNDLFSDITNILNNINKLDGKEIIAIEENEGSLKVEQIGTVKEKIEPTLSDRLAKSQTNEQAMAYAKLDKMKSGEVPASKEERSEMIDLYVAEIVDKLMKDI